MIVPMKKVTVLCLTRERDDALERLRDLGVVHLHPVRPPDDRDIEEARQHWLHALRALEALPRRAAGTGSGRAPAELVEAVWRTLHERQEAEERLGDLRREWLRIEPFGPFDPALVKELEKRGIGVRLYRCDPHQEPQAPEGVVLRVTRRTKEAIWFVAIGPAGRLPVREACEIRLPERGLRDIESEIARMERAIAELDERLKTYAADRPRVEDYVRELEDRVRFLEAKAGMGRADRVMWLRGFVPVDAVDVLQRVARERGWALLVEEPAEDDPVPTLLRRPKWVEPIRPVFDLIGVLPGYREVDISAVFLVFFSLFFGMLVGDAGYGLVFLGLTLLARRKMPRGHPGIRLMLIMSVVTIVWGALTGVWFGASRLPEMLAMLRSEWLTPADPVLAQQRMMGLCFLIGAVQLSLAHLWNFVRQRHSWTALAQLGWLGATWTMYWAAGTMVLGRPFPSYGLTVFGVSVLLIILFMTPWSRFKEEWFGHAMLPLNLVSNFVDVVSYIRLFAVGTATFAVAQAFNGMAFDIGRGSGLGRLIAALVLFLGHALNIALAGMGVVVHGVRLNTLEFSGHLGMQWSGIPYRPFARASTSEKKG